MKSTTGKKLRVFHGLVNYGTQAGMFAKELRAQGIDAISVSQPDPFKRLVDVELLYNGSIIEKIVKHSWNWTRRVYWFFRYNTFHFYYGTSLFPFQWDLPLYRLLGKKVVMEYLGYDVQMFQKSIEKYESTNVLYYKPQKVSKELDEKRMARLKSETRYLNKQFVCAPYLSEFVPGSSVLPLAIDLTEFKYVPKEAPESEIIIMHAPTSRDNKGTSFIMEAIDRLMKEGYPVKPLLIENITHAELKLKYIECDIFVDQVLGGWYGTASIEAMATGRPTVCFIRESYFEYIDYGDKIPIINATPSTIYEVLKNMIAHKNHFPEIGKKSRAFVEEVHDLKKLTKHLVKIYKEL